jgi:hypothetical protein
MRQPLWRWAIATIVLSTLWQARAAEPIAGEWRLKSQQVNGRETPSRPLLLRIVQSGDLLDFEYSVGVDQKKQVSLRFAARLDGSPAEVADSGGAKIGTARVTRAKPTGYLVTLEGPHRPTSSGKLTLSKDGKILASESDAIAPGGDKLHTIQTFERR